MSYCVYKHTFPNGKVYIGITGQKPENRWGLNGRGYNKQPLMHSAIRKYGWDSIKHEVLFNELTKEEAEQKEIELISSYKSNQIEFGYNSTSGGSVFLHSEETKNKIRNANSGENAPWYGKHLLEETKRKLSLSHKSIKMPPRSQEHRKKISESKLGHVVSEETRKKISNANKGRQCPEEIKKKFGDSVRCIETNEVYYSVKYAESQTGISRINISRVCRGKRKTAGGYHWEYVE